MNTGWIPVSEKLPNDGERVLVWHEYYRYGDFNCFYRTYGLGYIYEGSWYSPDVAGSNYKVLYWQPLPEVPEGEKYGVQKC